MSAVHFSASGLDETSATVIATYTYDLAGNRHTLARANGITTTYAYDGLNRLLTLSNSKNNSIVTSYAYILDNGGRRTSVTDQTNATTSYTYDNDNRLTGESSTAVGNVIYGYDNVGNRLTKSVNGSTNQSFTYDADDHVQNSGYSYDSNGNVLADGTNKYAYDWDNKMISSGLVTGNPTAFYTYDPDGLRVQEASSTSTTNFTNDPNSGYGNVVEERDQNANLVARYDYGDDLIDEQRQATGTSFYLFDGHGSTVQLTNTSGTVTDTYAYDAFGNLLAKTGTTPNSYLYNAQCQDGTTGLYYLRARYMDPARGEFEGMDPFEGLDSDPTSLHRYLYGGDQPVDMIDPGGTDSIDDMPNIYTNIFSWSLGSIILSAALDHGVVSGHPLWTMYVRAFAPWATFGLGFEGDNRTFTTKISPSITSRLTVKVRFSVDPLTIVSYSAVDHASHSYVTQATGSVPPMIFAYSLSDSLHIDAYGYNGLMTYPKAPPIQAHIVTTLTRDSASSGLDAVGYMNGTAFPNVEVFVVSPKGHATVLDDFATTGGQNSGPFTNLPFNDAAPMGNWSLDAPL